MDKGQGQGTCVMIDLMIDCHLIMCDSTAKTIALKVYIFFKNRMREEDNQM